MSRVLAEEVDIDPSMVFQNVLGFGGAFTDAAGINVARLSQSAQDHFMRFHKITYQVSCLLEKLLKTHVIDPLVRTSVQAVLNMVSGAFQWPERIFQPALTRTMTSLAMIHYQSSVLQKKICFTRSILLPFLLITIHFTV